MGVSFVTVGNFNIDNVVSAGGAISLQQAGGNALYSAIGAHIWSTDIGILSLIPGNYPQDLLDELSAAGIDLTGVKRLDPVVELEEWFFYQPDGSRIDHIYAPSARFFDKVDVPAFLDPARVKTILEKVQSYPKDKGMSFGQFRELNPIRPEHIPEIYWPIHGCHLAPNSYATHLDLARSYKDKGVLVSVDPAMYVRGLPEEKLADLLACTDIFLPSKKELNALFPGDEIEQALRRMTGLGPKVIGVKLGGEGSLIWDGVRDEIHHVSVYPSRVVDLTGAGDAYCGGCLVGMVETGDPLIAAQYGSVSASLVIEKMDIRMALHFNRYQANLRLNTFPLVKI